MDKQSEYQKAYAVFKDGKPEKAIKLYTKLLEKFGPDADILSDRGVAYFHMDNKVQALKDLQESLNIEPENPYRYSSIAYIKDSMGRTEEAIEDYKIAVKLDPEDAIAWNNLGLLEEKLGKIEQAKRRFQKSDEILGIDKGRDERFKKELDRLDNAPNPGSEKKIVPRNIQREINKEDKSLKKAGRGGIVKSVLTEKSEFKKFLQFVRNGFKIKE